MGTVEAYVQTRDGEPNEWHSSWEALQQTRESLPGIVNSPDDPPAEPSAAFVLLEATLGLSACRYHPGPHGWHHCFVAMLPSSSGHPGGTSPSSEARPSGSVVLAQTR